MYLWCIVDVRMKKKVWIVNHYAGNMLFSEGGRHYWFAKELQSLDYDPIVFCCNAMHGSKEMFCEEDALWQERKTKTGIPFVYIKSLQYSGNGVNRILNMFNFAWNFVRVAHKYAKINGKPDVIVASSVHPLTVLAGEHVAKRMKVPCICEIRDLWPESIFAYYPEKKTKLLAKLLYSGEKYMYKAADAIIMTWAGGADYIRKMGWEKEVSLDKVFHICNGIDLDEFDRNKTVNQYYDEDLSDDSYFKAIYTGSIRKVNNLKMVVEAAEILQTRGNEKIKILIWGSGTELEELQKTVDEKQLHNIKFKGRVPKQNVPSILSQGSCTIMHNTSTVLDCYGQSQNKFFEYLAAAKPVLMTYTVGYSICKRENCGIELNDQNPKSIADALEYMSTMPKEEYEALCQNARSTAVQYDFKVHTQKLVDIIESL